MASGFPDWLRAVSMLGKYGEEYKIIRVDEDGQLYALVRGIDGDDELHTLAVDDAGQLIMVPRGASGHYLLVDSDGYFTTVIKGETVGEELQTVRLDDQGRLSAFVIDSTDAWGQMLSIGNAELAARLGSPVCYERTGEVQFIENFGYGLQKWAATTSGGGASVTLSPVSSASGGYSVKMVGGSTTLFSAWLGFRRGLLPQAKLGLSVGFAIPTTIDRFEARIMTYDATTWREAGIRFDDVDNVLDYLHSGGAWREIAPVGDGPRLAGAYNYLKLVADFENEMYVRGLFNQDTHDLSDHAIKTNPSEMGPYIVVEFTLYSRSGFNDFVYVDDVVFTDAEL